VGLHRLRISLAPSITLPAQALAQLGAAVHSNSPAQAVSYQSLVKPVTGPLSEYVSALLAVEFDAGVTVEITSLPHEFFTLSQWLGSSHSRFECSVERGMRSNLHGIRTRPAVMNRPGDFLMLRAFLTPLGAILLASGQPLPDMSAPKLAPWAHSAGMLTALELERAVLDQPSIERKFEAFAYWIERRVRGRRRANPAALRAAHAATLLSSEPALDLQALAQQAGVTRRQLERDFANWLSLSPRRFAQTVRLQQLARIASQRTFSLAQLAAETGFSDQAHMNRTVRQLTGMTPLNFLRAAHNDISRSYRQALGGRIGYIVRTAAEE
jgi:AraC-like DNA-binding protein